MVIATVMNDGRSWHLDRHCGHGGSQPSNCSERGNAAMRLSGCERRPRRLARLGDRSGREPRALHQPRAVLAALQPPRAGGGRATPAIRCSSGCASCRSRPTTSTNSSWCASPASRARCAPASPTKSPDGLTPAEQLARIGEAVVGARQRPADALARAARGAAPSTASCWSTAGRDQEGRPAWLEDHFLRPDLPGADAARDRSGASVPVHSQSRLHPRAAARARRATARR